MTDKQKVETAMELLDEVFHSESVDIAETLTLMQRVKQNVDYYVKECRAAMPERSSER